MFKSIDLEKPITLGSYIDLHRTLDLSDIDICDNYDDSAWRAYCGTKLTDEGKKKYAKALSLKIVCVINDGGCGRLIVNTPTEKDTKCLRDFLTDMAGYCSCEEYDRCFNDED